jgi:apolipoprotein N-acyltransferase
MTQPDEEVPFGRADRLQGYAVAVFGGVLYFLGFAGFDLWPFAFIALVPLLWLLETRANAPLRHRLCLGAIYGFTQQAGGFYWIVEMLGNFSGFSTVPNILIASLCWGAHGIQFSFFAWLYGKARGRGWSIPLVAVSLFSAMEFLYPALFPNFLANSLHDLPYMMQIVDLGGPILLSALIVLVNAVIAVMVVRHRAGKDWPKRQMAIAVAAVLLTLGYGGFRIAATDELTSEADHIRVGLVQVSMGIFEKRENPGEMHRRHVRQTLTLERESSPDLIVWPESAYSRILPSEAENVARWVFQAPTIHGTVGPVHTPILFGGISSRLVDGGRRIYNTAFLLDETGEIQGTYDKTFLLAFGEYLPFGETFPFLYEWSPNSGRFTPGSHVRALPFRDYRLATLVCYEDVVPSFTRRMVRESNPDLLVNISNDAWFGETNEPWIHLALAKFRAVEHHRALVRVTNSGVSAVIDPSGRVVTHSGVFTRENLVADVPMVRTETLYALWGDWFGTLAALFVLIMVFRAPPPRWRDATG